MAKNKLWERINNNLQYIYSPQDADIAYKQLLYLFNTSKDKSGDIKNTSTLPCLITYANSIKKDGEKPLVSLASFIRKNDLNHVFDLIHILPFYPWDTDRGFSVSDYYKVNPDYGTWDDIKSLSQLVPLMFDFVANHASISNPIVQSALIVNHLSKNDPQYALHSPYKNFVITYSEKTKPTDDQLSKLTRPRPTPVLSEYVVVKKGNKYSAYLGNSTNRKDKVIGSGYVWTTFSRPKNALGLEETRQVDLNFKNPAVLVEAIKIMLFYHSKGASWIRLDAIGYIWKKIGSSSLHEKEAHIIIRIISDFLTIVISGIVTVSEVNEPQEKALKYLGSKQNPEADIFYQFSHFPLAVYGFLTGDTKPYKKWIDGLPQTNGRQFITVLGSHDGMGLKPILNFLSDTQREKLINILIKSHGALPNYSMLPGGIKIVYEICATPWNLINKSGSDATDPILLNKYISVLALGLLQRGTPAIYINGLLGCPNYSPKEGLDENRTINREVLDLKTINNNVLGKSHTALVFEKVTNLLKVRKQSGYFKETASKPILLKSSPSTIVIMLKNENGSGKLLSVTNFTSSKTKIFIEEKVLGKSNHYKDLISGRQFTTHKEKIAITLDPFETTWIVSSS